MGERKYYLTSLVISPIFDRMSQRIVFTFDDRSHAELLEAKKAGGYESLADTIRGGLRLLRAIQKQRQAGFENIEMRKSGSSRVREIVFP